MSDHSKPFALRLPPDIMAEIKLVADAETRSVNQMILVALKEWLASRKAAS